MICPQLYDSNIPGGGKNGSDVQDFILQFLPDDGSWNQVGQMKVARQYHAASVVNFNDIADYCG